MRSWHTAIFQILLPVYCLTIVCIDASKFLRVIFGACLFSRAFIRHIWSFSRRAHTQYKALSPWLTSTWLMTFSRLPIIKFTGIFHSMFGLPKDCVHQNVVHSCKLSFSCWLEGGRHGEGCGSNKWLFSCCIHEKRTMALSEMGLMGTSTVDVAEVVPPTSFNHNKHVIKSNYLYKNEIDLPVRMPYRTTPKYRYKYYYRMKSDMLRRRIDDEPVSDLQTERWIVANGAVNPFSNFSFKFSVCRGMWNTENGGKYHSETHHRRTSSAFCRISLAGTYSRGWISMRRRSGWALLLVALTYLYDQNHCFSFL